MKISVRSLARGDGWSAGDVVCGAGPLDRPYEEQHRAFAIAVVLEGSFLYRTGRRPEIMPPGSLLIGHSGQAFECSHEHGVGDRCLSIHYEPEYFVKAGIDERFPVNRLPPLGEFAGWVVQAQVGVRVPRRVASPGSAFEELAHGLVGAVAEAARRVPGLREGATAAEERRISAAVRFIEGNLSERLPLDRLAKISGMSEFHFLRTFRKVVGLTPHRYVMRARLREAATRLKSGKTPVTQVALETGFGDLSNFHQAFRVEFGISPARFRT